MNRTVGNENGQGVSRVKSEVGASVFAHLRST